MEHTNPDIPFERQMLHILRSYQHLQDEVLRLRAENSRLAMRLLVAKQALQHAAPPIPDTAKEKVKEKAKQAVAAIARRDAEIRQLIAKLSHLHGLERPSEAQ